MAGILVALVVLLPWSGTVAVWLVRNNQPKLQHALAVSFSAAAAAASLFLLLFVSSDAAIQLLLGRAFVALTFVPDGLAVSLTTIATVIGLLCVIFYAEYMRGDTQLGRYYFLVLFFIGAMTVLRGLSRVLSTTLLFHETELETTLQLMAAVTSAPTTWFALLVIACGFGLFWWRGRTSALTRSRLQLYVNTSFGLESINHAIVRGISEVAESLRVTQTGELNWNILGIISGALVVLLALWMGA